MFLSLCHMSFSKLVFFFSRSPISVAAASIYLASQASDGKKSQKGELKSWGSQCPTCHKFLHYKSFLEIGDIAGVADVTIRQAYRLMYPKVAELFPTDFKFFTPIEKLPSS